MLNSSARCFWQSGGTELGPRLRLDRRYWLVWLASRRGDSDVPMSTTLPAPLFAIKQSHQSRMTRSSIPSLLLYKPSHPATAKRVEHFLSFSSFGLPIHPHPSLNQHIHPSIHPPTHIISFLPSIESQLRTTSTYLPLATYQSRGE
jgi:hypothetical protein